MDATTLVAAPFASFLERPRERILSRLWPFLQTLAVPFQHIVQTQTHVSQTPWLVRIVVGKLPWILDDSDEKHPCEWIPLGSMDINVQTTLSDARAYVETSLVVHIYLDRDISL